MKHLNMTSIENDLNKDDPRDNENKANDNAVLMGNDPNGNKWLRELTVGQIPSGSAAKFIGRNDYSRNAFELVGDVPFETTAGKATLDFERVTQSITLGDGTTLQVSSASAFKVSSADGKPAPVQPNNQSEFNFV